MKTQLRLLEIFLFCYLVVDRVSGKSQKTQLLFWHCLSTVSQQTDLVKGPILKQISEETGFKVNFKTAPDIPTFEKLLVAGNMTPFIYILTIILFFIKPKSIRCWRGPTTI
ncbi:MAG: hypothetical protein ACI9V8_001017 [Urechidicola sp.]|jgi:hypothetical protein